MRKYKYSINEGNNKKNYYGIMAEDLMVEARPDSELNDAQKYVKNLTLKDIKANPVNKTKSYEVYELVLKDSKYNKALQVLMDKEIGGNIKQPQFHIENIDLNRIHVQGIPSAFRNLGFGKKLYEKAANKVGFITTKPHDRTDKAANVWSSLARDSSNAYYANINGQEFLFRKRSGGLFSGVDKIFRRFGELLMENRHEAPVFNKTNLPKNLQKEILKGYVGA